jgi:hypothetical protein
METFWNCKDKDGKTSLTNLEKDTIGKDCVMVQKQRLTVVPSTRPPTTPAPRRDMQRTLPTAPKSIHFERR